DLIGLAVHHAQRRRAGQDLLAEAQRALDPLREEPGVDLVAAAREQPRRDQAPGIPVRAAKVGAALIAHLTETAGLRVALDRRDLVAENPGMAAAHAAVLVLPEPQAGRRHASAARAVDASERESDHPVREARGEEIARDLARDRRELDHVE